MAKVLVSISSLWERFAKFIFNLSFRYTFVCLAFIFCFVPGNLSFLSDLDKFVLSLVSRASGIQVGPAEISIVTVPDDIVRAWESDFYHADDLSSLLSNILHSSSASIGLILDRPLAGQVTKLDDSLSLAIGSDGDLRQLLVKKEYLNELLNDPRVVLGSLSAPFDKIPELKLSMPSDLPVDPQLAKFWYRDCFLCEKGIQREVNGDWYPVLSLSSLKDYLWLPSTNGYLSSFLSALALNKQALAVTGGAQALTDSPSLFSSYLIAGENRSIPIQPFISAYKTNADFSPKIISLTLEEALLVNAFPDFVLIVSQAHAPLALDKAASLYSLIHQQTYSVAWWLEPFSRVLLFLLVLYLAFLHFKIRSAKNRWLSLTAIFLTAFGSFIFVAVHFTLWIPVTSLLLYSGISVLVMSLWWYRRTQRSLVAKELTGAIDSACAQLEESKQFGLAMSLLAHYPKPQKGVEKICRLANKMEDEKLPLRRVIAAVDSVLPIVGSNSKIHDELLRLKQTQAQQNDLFATQASEGSVDEDIPEKLGRYQIQKEIGRGAVGVVYLGFDPAIARKVAIKTLDARQFSRDQHESLQARFFREAEAAGRLNHPNIVSVFDVGEEGDLAFIAMDYVEGMPLSDCIQKSHLLPVVEIFRAVHDVALALSYAHENQIVHRDIKPGNIMYCAEPYTLKVADFGIARLLDNSKTSTGEILGSPLYMAPEQLKGSKVGPTADIFSLGVTFYQLLSGELPFNADNLASLTYEIIHTKHKNIRGLRKDLPASAARIVNQCLQKRPDDRYESAIELAGVLRKAIRRDFPTEAKRWNMY